MFPHHKETSQLTCSAELVSIWWETLIVNGLKTISLTSSTKALKGISTLHDFFFSRVKEIALHLYFEHEYNEGFNLF